MVLGTFSALNASEKIYIDEEELNTSQDAFHIHIGNNVWIETNTVHRDKTGLYTYENNILSSTDKNTQQFGYQKTWKCPYCYNYWPIGTPCQNPSCPSKYR